ncbi:MAG TPA: TetR/AcrR family transcriptional regulator [Acidimicrobiales bacterium]
MGVSPQEKGRAAQRAWTRGRIIEAANELMAAGDTPSVSDAATVAGVSRATAYRYFPTQGDLLIAAVAQAMGEVGDAVPTEPGDDAAEALAATARWLIRSTVRNEHQLRALYAHLLDAWLRERRGEQAERLPRGARIPHIERALTPLRAQLGEREFRRLAAVVSVLIGIEGWMALHDMWGMDAAEAEETLLWAMQTLLDGVSR